MHDERTQEAIDLAADGALDERDRGALERHLDACTGCRAELARAERVVARLAAARIPVRPGFARGVMAALEPAPWEARSLRAWRLPVALLVALAAASAALFGGGAAAFAPAGGAGGALLALADLLRAAVLAGAGLATASWRAVGDATASWLGGEPGNWVAAIVLVAGVNLLLVRLLRLRRPAAERLPGARRRK
jgi:anti-sigma factor RsiW